MIIGSMVNKAAERVLFAIAETQEGFFTTKQATQAGFTPKEFGENVKIGKWKREGRGIYRLLEYPVAPYPQLMLWYLWSRNQKEEMEGVYSHETALFLHELLQESPQVPQMTVPRHFRKPPPSPEMLRLYYEDLLRSDIMYLAKVKVTNPVRSIFDVIIEGRLPEQIIKDVMYYALIRKLIPAEEQLFLYPKVLENSKLEIKMRKYLRDIS